MKIIKKIALTLLLVLVALQFYSPPKNNSQGNHAAIFVTETNPPPNVRIIITQSCFNCHSNNTEYPWYNNIAPVSYWLANHIKTGKEHLNLSEWDAYDPEEKALKLEAITDVIEGNKMPLKEYRWAHENARLSEEQKQAIIAWAKSTKVLYQLGRQPK